MRTAIVLCMLVGLALASPPHYGPLVYVGRYRGVCGKDGLYLNDPFSFVSCSNGNPYVQPCAPGTRNKAFGYYVAGKHGQSEFCSVNLNDLGYAVNVNAGLHGYYPFRAPRIFYPY